MTIHLSSTAADRLIRSQLIDGRSAEAASGRRIDVVCPSDGALFASIPQSGAEDVDLAGGVRTATVYIGCLACLA